jgi:hypothetical protein
LAGGDCGNPVAGFFKVRSELCDHLALMQRIGLRAPRFVADRREPRFPVGAVFVGIGFKTAPARFHTPRSKEPVREVNYPARRSQPTLLPTSLARHQRHAAKSHRQRAEQMAFRQHVQRRYLNFGCVSVRGGTEPHRSGSIVFTAIPRVRQRFRKHGKDFHVRGKPSRQRPGWTSRDTRSAALAEIGIDSNGAGPAVNAS